jgi:hypothetical protein
MSRRWKKTKNWVIVHPKNPDLALTWFPKEGHGYWHKYSGAKTRGLGSYHLQPRIYVYMPAALKAAKKAFPTHDSWMVMTLNEYIDRMD